jgi:hypothetical protein
MEMDMRNREGAIDLAKRSIPGKLNQTAASCQKGRTMRGKQPRRIGTPLIADWQIVTAL